jgi:predicted HTH domain antitoxin
MQTIAIEIPDVIWESHDQNISAVREEMRRGLVIWEYLNGHLTIGECGEILKTGYRGFLELLWNRGIPADALTDDELEHQLSLLRKLTDN